MFYSVLFPDEESAKKPRNRQPLDCFRDMNLDQITRRVLQEKQIFALDEYFYTPLTDIRTVRYRQEVMRELADSEKRHAFENVLGQITFMRTVIDADDGRTVPILTMGPIGITPELKRQGYGKLLLDYSLQKAAEMGCGAVCFEGNIDFYGNDRNQFLFAAGSRLYLLDRVGRFCGGS